MQAAGVPTHPSGPGDLRSYAGGKSEVWPGGLSALHLLGALARCCGELEVGDGVRLEGRLQSRAYTKLENGESCQRTAFEVSVMRLEGVEV